MAPRRFAVLRMPLYLAALQALFATPAHAAQRSAEAAATFEPCQLPGIAEELRCGSFSVYEDREARTGRRIGLRIVILPARTPDLPEPDPLFLLAGGPGQGATALAGFAVRQHAKVRRSREIVLVDQRGTGDSNPLVCDLGDSDENLQAYLGVMFPEEVIRDCRPQLEKHADLTRYTTPIAMDDLDDIRGWLGYERINLYGTSYGTRAALVYMRRHPEHVRTAVLSGVAPTNFKMPAEYAQDAQRALDGLFDECAQNLACSIAFPEIGDEFAAVLERLDAGPAKTTMPHPITGRSVTVDLSRDAFAATLRFMLYTPRNARRVPALIHQAYAHDDFGPFATTGVQIGRSLAGQVNIGMFLSVTCAEDIPLVDQYKAMREAKGTYLGDFRIRQQFKGCGYWPQASLPPGYNDPVRSDAPVLIISGELDPVTPPRWGDEAARHLPNSLHVVVPGGAHSNPFICVSNIIAAFISDGSVEELETSCVSRIRTPPFIIPVASR